MTRYSEILTRCEICHARWVTCCSPSSLREKIHLGVTTGVLRCPESLLVMTQIDEPVFEASVLIVHALCFFCAQSKLIEA
mmetsp:Transcript_89779/g.141775  ORF Transcript_89779/g.141775 Transcript_89779/m.141775 type:complete len:80 (-) Transcript_89779:184-423(-)